MGIAFHDAYADFPDPALDRVGELVAIGGDLEPQRLLAAYAKGIFPWYDETSPILWWSPDPRLLLVPGEMHIPRRLTRFMRQKTLAVTVNMSCPQVIESCAGVKRRGMKGTWLVPEMIAAYTHLHQLGYVHSVETWQEGRLVGGVYGVALGRAFFGESMFHLVSNASKVALVSLVQVLQRYGVHFMDCQQTTRHLLSFGAREFSRRIFMHRLQSALEAEPLPEEAWRARRLDY
ncbi:leucyl/phenylalanyl-tRNA--protein transferase [Desulfovermiculus halophilus]|jgi:leucyl/phenylalanyl-tRNA--protein transferase|uniref:leucyl/phenylalanyl-tRNA--protein transferase n=1 Tax=Desulfovermiculus halophilus TaxID=339722 RepID=UPI00048188FE|nr:leucyl/phenylalanyl-tRNA--protein transferase [Desulfovermiculus halophilus]